MTDTTAGEGVIVQHEADLLLDNIACATQNRSLLRGDPAEDKVLTEAVLENGKQAISRAITKALAAQPSAGAQGGVINRERDPLMDHHRLGVDREDLLIAIPAQPDTGDVAALREALEGIDFDYDPGEPEGSGYRLIMPAIDAILAALSKPNVPGAA